MLGLCIRYFNPNYGGMLQGYATIKLLQDRGFDVELIRYEKKRDIKLVISSIPRLWNPILRYEKSLQLSKKINGYFHPEFRRNESRRRMMFREFEEQYFAPKERKYYGYDALKKGAENYEVIVTGSDQIWSPSGLESNFYNLMFAPDEKRKVSLASSFGVSKIPANQIERTREYLQRIPHISMRENRGSEIVEELTGRTVPVILDPVFMLSAEEWSLLAGADECCEEKYLFAYLLGTDSAYRERITAFARDRNLKIVTLRHANQYVKADETFGDYCFFDVGPCEFLSLTKNASIICTDSYHGSIFSLILHKEFIVFDRYSDDDVYSKNSRIDTFCENFKLKDRRYKRNRELRDMIKTPIDYERVDSVMKRKRDEFNQYLDSALSR